MKGLWEILRCIIRTPNAYIYARRFRRDGSRFNYWMYELKVLKNPAQIVDIIMHKDRLIAYYCEQAYRLRHGLDLTERNK